MIGTSRRNDSRRSKGTGERRQMIPTLARPGELMTELSGRCRALTLVSKGRLCRVVPGAGSCTKPGLCRVVDTARHDTAREKLCQVKGVGCKPRGAQGHALSKSNLVVIVAGISRQLAKFKFNMVMKAL